MSLSFDRARGQASRPGGAFPLTHQPVESSCIATVPSRQRTPDLWRTSASRPSTADSTRSSTSSNPLCIAVIGVGHIGRRRPAGKLQQRANTRVMLGRAAVEQGRVIQAIHRNDQVEALEIVVLHLPCAQAREVDAPAGGSFDSAWIGRLTHVISVSAGGVDLDVETRGVPASVRAEHAFGGGRSTDIAHADEQYFHRDHIPAIQ